MESTIGRSLTENILRASVFGHFGGEDTAEELSRKVEALAQRNIGILFAYTSEQIDHNLSVKYVIILFVYWPTAKQVLYADKLES